MGGLDQCGKRGGAAWSGGLVGASCCDDVDGGASGVVSGRDGGGQGKW